MKFGRLDIAKLYYGGRPIVAAYVGNKQVWPAPFGKPFAGFMLSQSLLSGQMAVVRTEAGSVVCISAMAGGLVRQVNFTGSMASISVMAGDLDVTRDILFTGSVVAVSQIAGELAVLRNLAASMATISAMQGNFAVSRNYAATAGAISALTGGINRSASLAGTIAAISAMSGAMTVARTLLEKIQMLGLTANLKLCLDAGDVASFAGTGTKWLDTAGSGYDFFLGATNSAEGSDPAFNGTAGAATSSEYWSFDGGDYFTYDTTNETWMQNIHKTGGLLTVCVWLYLNTRTASQYYAGTVGVNASGTGFVLFVSSGGNISFTVRDAGTARHQIQSSGTTINTGSWYFLGVSYDESLANGTENSFVINGTSTGLNVINTSATRNSGNASYDMQIGAGGNALNPMQSGSRMAGFLAWDRVLSPTELDDIYQSTRARFGV
jgi:hypothetical protein